MLARLIVLLGMTFAYATPASAEWQQAKTRHFIIYADAETADLQGYATKLERFDQAVRIARKMADPPLTDAGRLTIYAFKDIAAFDRLLETGSGIYGVYFARASGSLAYVARNTPHGPGELTSDIVFFHEYTHHLMLQGSSAYYPPWLREGFAEFLSTADIGENGTVTFGGAANHRSAGVYAPDHDFPVSAMVGDSYRSLDGWQWELLYSRGWLLTHYLTFEPTRKGQLERYVAEIQAGHTPLESARTAFGDLLQLDHDLDEYARRRSLSGISIQTDPAKIGSIAIRPLTEAEVAILPVQMESDFGVSPGTADRVAGKARRVESRFSDDPVVEGALAEAEYDADHYSTSVEAAERALAADPNNVHALIYKGRALMKEAKDKPTDANWEDIRSWFILANHLDAENPEPLKLYYQSFKEASAAPTPGAVRGLLYALVLAPQDDKLRLLAVRQLLLDRRVPEAKIAFGPLASDPHAREFHSTAQDIVAAMAASDAATAVSLIDAWTAKQKNDD
jgi:tetratricopeptide (TPR) repeat protein